MTVAALDGKHTHATQDGQQVHIFRRDGRFLARARWGGQQIGATLGTSETEAAHGLRRLLTEMEDGTFVPGRERRGRQSLRRPIPRCSLRILIEEFLAEKRRLRGPNTAKDYTSRLMHVLDFAELPANIKKWPLAKDIDRRFAIELRTILFQRQVARNGRAGATTRPMSPTMVRLCLETLRGALDWARRADVRRLPADYFNPITTEIIGGKKTKDPLRACPLPLEARIAMIHHMDRWQLLQLSTLLVLPTRFEDVAGALISDFELQRGTWRLGSRFGGNDHNKGHAEVQMPLPPILVGLLNVTANGRGDGPMFRSRCAADAKTAKVTFESRADFEGECQAEISRARHADVETEQGRKLIIRELLCKCGGITTDAISRELKKLMGAAGIAGVQPYAIREAVTTDMHCAGMRLLELRYLTMHALNDIMNVYTALNPAGEMQKYFVVEEPLLAAIQHRAVEVGIALE